MKIAICDDKKDQIEIIKLALMQYFATQTETTIEVREFINPVHFCDTCEKDGNFDIVLLDICMPGLSGINVAKEIRQRKADTEIVFLTTSDEFAVDAFALKATHYLVKPFTQKQFDIAMDRAMAHFSNNKRVKLLINVDNGGVQIVDAEKVFYIESVGYKRIVHLSQETITEVRRSLAVLSKELEVLLPNQFIASYKGYIVNLDAVKTITPKEIIMQNGDKLPVKSGDFRKLRNLLFARSFRGVTNHD